MGERLAFGYGTSRHEAPPREPVRRRPPDGEPPDAPPAPDGRPGSARRDWAFTGLLAFTALLFLRPQDQIVALRFLPMADVAAIVALGAMAAGRLGRGLPLTRLTPELAGVIALGGLMLALAPFSIWMGGVVGTFTGMYVKVILIFLLMVNTLTSPRRVEQVVWLLVLASGYLSARAVFDYTRGVNLVEYGRVRGAVGGMFRNPNDLAMNMVTMLPFAGFLALRRLPPLRRGVAAFCALTMVGAIICSQSRAATVALALMLFAVSVLLVRRRPGLVFAAGLAVVMAMPMLPASYWARMKSITNPEMDQTGSREARSIVLAEAYATFLAHPLTGVGAGQFKNYNPEGRQEAWRETHNVVLQVAAEMGVLGLMVFGFLLWRAGYAPVQARRLLKLLEPGRSARPRAPPGPALPDGEHEMLTLYAGVLPVAFLGWFVCALFGSIAYHWTFYYLLALTVAPRDYLAGHLAAGRAARPPVRAGAIAAAGARA